MVVEQLGIHLQKERKKGGKNFDPYLYHITKLIQNKSYTQM